MSFGIPVRNGVALGLAGYAALGKQSAPPAPPPVSGVLSHTLLQIGMTAPG